jgi:hypothetical protein
MDSVNHEEGRPLPHKAHVPLEETLMHAESIAHILQFFTCDHLPSILQEVSRPCCELAHTMHQTLAHSEELLVGLRKLLEAKDCFERARLG